MHDQPHPNKAGGDYLATPVPIDTEGTAHLPAFSVPLSHYMSAAAKKAFFANARIPQELFQAADIGHYRRTWDRLFYAPLLEKARRHHAVEIEHSEIGGVPVDIITPTAGVTHRRRSQVLINLHGGGFTIGAGLGGQVESVPIADRAGIKVISVDYRQGPEHRFPAASEDVAAVYRALLKKYAPESIGVFGCSAGGLLSAMAVPWLLRAGLPLPGAIALLCAAADDRFDGDSRYTAPPLVGQLPPYPQQVDLGMMGDYLQGTDSSDPCVCPIASEQILRQFPPTLITTATRAGEMSAAVHSHAHLVHAGARAFLHVWEGLWHGFSYDTELPESQQLFDVVARFFDRHLRP